MTTISPLIAKHTKTYSTEHAASTMCGNVLYHVEYTANFSGRKFLVITTSEPHYSIWLIQLHHQNLWVIKKNHPYEIKAGGGPAVCFYTYH